ncbi:uncharacterized protein LOC132063059 [Lycium ferocissimum]|uniref:uncharacterized protein LOC132063059 n=1 Tax=Lycium ferocissimum TaxID=112874 RepID=UPI00281541E7|nr:uncharacterized protein LOC132063059 [Lycium ferocissimum]
MFIKLVNWKKKADELMFHTLIRVHPQVIQQHPARAMRGIRLINWFILLFGVISVILLFYCFFTSAVKLLGISTGSGNRNITVYNMNHWWTENRKMATSNNDQWTENNTNYFDLSILASETTANVKTPLHNTNGITIDPIEHVNETDQVPVVSLASTDITSGYLTRPKVNCALKFGTTDETTCHPSLVLMPEQQLTNNLDASSPIGVDNEASCLAFDVVQEMNTEIEQN